MEKKKNSTFAYIIKWAGQKKGFYGGSVFLAILSVIAKLAPYFFIGLIVNNLISGVKDPKIYIRNIIIILVLFLLSELFHTISTTMSHSATFEVLKNIRTALLEKLVRMPLGKIMQRGTGSIKNTMMERVDSIETTLAHIIPEFTSNLVAPILIFVYLLTIDVRMAFIALIPVGIGILFTFGLFGGYGKSYQKCVDTTKILNDTAVEYVSGIEVIKAFSKTEGSYKKFVKAAKDNANAFVSWMKRCAFCQSSMLTFLPYTLLSVLPFGAWFVSNGSLLLSDFILCVILSIGLLTPLVILSGYTDDLAVIGTVVDEISEILEEPETSHPEKSVSLPKDNSVELKNVTFAYGEKDVLHNVNMRFEPNTINAIVGPSGGGKSTIAKLIAGFWDVKDGGIYFGGAKSSELSTEDLRKEVAYVSQNNYLFNETVRENIRQGNPNASDAEVEEIAKKSGCYDFIMNLENGFDTVVGSSGGHLSGGEKQRISIARAMLKDAPIIILDEATAYTDPENEAIIEQAIAHLVKGKTLIMIAHRLYTIQSADKIYFINNGKLEASGSHEELLENSNLYKNMWNSHIATRDNSEEA